MTSGHFFILTDKSLFRCKCRRADFTGVCLPALPSAPAHMGTGAQTGLGPASCPAPCPGERISREEHTGEAGLEVLCCAATLLTLS